YVVCSIGFIIVYTIIVFSPLGQSIILLLIQVSCLVFFFFKQKTAYDIIYNLTAEIMEQPCRLIETVAWRIAHEIRRSFPAISPITVTVHKLSPELGGTVQSTKVEYTLV